MIPGMVLLSGVVGSTAYGMATPESDVDRIGLFAAPTTVFHGLGVPPKSDRTTSPDAIFYEAAHWLRLALACNPGVTELVWLNDYETVTPLGEELISLRASLLSASKVRDSYLRYAADQFRRLKNRGDGSFSSDTRKRTAKHARHLWRLLQQGCDLHQTGRLTVRLSPNQAANCRAFGDLVAAGETYRAEEALRDAETMFGKPGVLPDRPDESAAEAWLLRVRAAMWDHAVDSRR